MTLSELREVERELEGMQRWDGDGQMVDHGRHGAFNDKLRATWRAIRRDRIGMDVDTAYKLVRSL